MNVLLSADYTYLLTFSFKIKEFANRWHQAAFAHFVVDLSLIFSWNSFCLVGHLFLPFNRELIINVNISLIIETAISIKLLPVHWNSAIIPLSSIAFRANLAWKNLVNISFCAPVLNRTLDTQRREVNFEKIQNILTQAVFSDRVTLNYAKLLDVFYSKTTRDSRNW